MKYCDGCSELNKRLKHPCNKGFRAYKSDKTGKVVRPSACKIKVKPSKLDSDKGINDLLDKTWSKAVRSIGFCEHCGKIMEEKKLQAHHIFSRRHRSTRWLYENGVCLCYGCHIEWAHKDIMEFSDWITKLKGFVEIENLRRKANTEVKFTLEEKKAILDGLKQICEGKKNA